MTCVPRCSSAAALLDLDPDPISSLILAPTQTLSESPLPRRRRACLSRVLGANSRPLYCTLRTRKRCEVFDAAGARTCAHHVLNDAVIDRCVCVWGGG